MRKIYLLGIFIPIAVALELMHADPLIVFLAAALGVIPTAALMGAATEHISAQTGPGVGGFMNVTFGNAPELIIAFFALNAGLHNVVKASIVGSIIGNLLLVLGAALVVGGRNREKQEFNRTSASAQTSMLLIATTLLAFPAIFELIKGGSLPTPGNESFVAVTDIAALSAGISVVLLLMYAAGLYFSLKTHREVFNPYNENDDAHELNHEHWSIKKSLVLLGISAVLVGLMSEVLVGSISEASETIGLSEFFVGAFVVAVVGNAAEHWVAIAVAAKNKMDLAVGIAIGSSAQIALFVAPVLMLLSFVAGPHSMPLVFNGYELAAMLFAVLATAFITQDGETNWFEGVQLLLLYAGIGLVFYFA